MKATGWSSSVTLLVVVVVHSAAKKPRPVTPATSMQESQMILVSSTGSVLFL